MHKITRISLAVINGLAQFGANVRAYLLALHINALTALVNKADEEADSMRRAIDRAIKRADDAEAKAAQLAYDAATEAAKHGVTLEV
jgi:hypothetical protein